MSTDDRDLETRLSASRPAVEESWRAEFKLRLDDLQSERRRTMFLEEPPVQTAPMPRRRVRRERGTWGPSAAYAACGLVLLFIPVISLVGAGPMSA